MVYKNNIPAPGDSPAVDSQADLLENFAQLETQYSGDHVALTALINNGMHTQIRFEAVLALDPNLVTPQASLYTKADIVSGATELFFQNDALAADVVQLTGIDPNNVGTDYGYVTPWGQTINWGTSTASALGPVTTFAVPFVVGATSLIITSNATSGISASYNTLNLNNFRAWTGSPIATGMSYFAIGV